MRITKPAGAVITLKATGTVNLTNCYINGYPIRSAADLSRFITIEAGATVNIVSGFPTTASMGTYT